MVGSRSGGRSSFSRSRNSSRSRSRSSYNRSSGNNSTTSKNNTSTHNDNHTSSGNTKYINSGVSSGISPVTAGFIGLFAGSLFLGHKKHEEHKHYHYSHETNSNENQNQTIQSHHQYFFESAAKTYNTCVSSGTETNLCRQNLINLLDDKYKTCIESNDLDCDQILDLKNLLVNTSSE